VSPRSQRCGITLAALLLVLAAASSVRVALIADDEHPQAAPQSPTEPVGPIIRGVRVRQEFTALGSRIGELRLRLATYRRSNPGTLEILVDSLETGGFRRLAKQTLRQRTIVDNVWHAFRFRPALEVERGQKVAVTLSSDRNSPKEAVTWWMVPSFSPPHSSLSINGVRRQGAATFQVAYEEAAGRAGGPMWQRLTILLGPLGKVMLGFGALLAMTALLHMLLWPPRETRQQ
jgi:hypothetical protein